MITMFSLLTTAPTSTTESDLSFTSIATDSLVFTSLSDELSLDITWDDSEAIEFTSLAN